ncbi:response regulator [Paludibaculum fermentans]|uniref:response regulator n=1 Tax=Paludibaculum fermentans TaxID=1473598 RepID=UPI003EB86B64
MKEAMNSALSPGFSSSFRSNAKGRDASRRTIGIQGGTDSVPVTLEEQIPCGGEEPPKLPATPAKISSKKLSVTALLVSASEEDRHSLQGIFSRLDWTLHVVQTIREARKRMIRAVPLPIVISDQHLPDGSWKLLFREAEKLRLPPRFIVSSRLADDGLWVEVLILGGQDVLATPFESREVLHVFSHAWKSWHQQWEATLGRNGTAGRTQRGLNRPIA